MGIVGKTKDLLDQAKEKLAAADVEGANALIDEARVSLSGIADLVADVDSIAEGLKEAPKWVLGLVELAQADFTKIESAAGHYGELAQKLVALVVLLRDGKHIHVRGLNFGGELNISGEAWIE